VNVGKLNTRINVQEPSTETANAYGERLDTWTLYATVWAAVTPLTLRQVVATKQVSVDAQYQVEMRYLAGITAKMRVYYAARYYDIVNIETDDKTYHKLLLRETR